MRYLYEDSRPVTGLRVRARRSSMRQAVEYFKPVYYALMGRNAFYMADGGEKINPEEERKS